MLPQEPLSFEEILEKIKVKILRLQKRNSQKSLELSVYKDLLRDFIKAAEELKNEQRFDFEDVVYKFKASAELLLN